MLGLEQSVILKIKTILTYRRFNEIIIYSTFIYNNKKCIIN